MKAKWFRKRLYKSHLDLLGAVISYFLSFQFETVFTPRQPLKQSFYGHANREARLSVIKKVPGTEERRSRCGTRQWWMRELLRDHVFNSGTFPSNVERHWKRSQQSVKRRSGFLYFFNTAVKEGLPSLYFPSSKIWKEK